ncbi:MAG: helix-turn-helix domain-containing protein [Pseudolabrys sp.]
MPPKPKDDGTAKADKRRDGFFGDWLKRGDDPQAALMGFMSEAALAKFGEALNGYLTKTALAKEFGVSERTIDRWRNQPNGLPFTTAGATVLFNIASVRKWLDKRERHPNKRRAAA